MYGDEDGIGQAIKDAHSLIARVHAYPGKDGSNDDNDGVDCEKIEDEVANCHSRENPILM